MKMTEKEYKDLIARIRFIADKCDECYEKEVDRAVERIEEEYKKCIIK